MSGRLDLGVGLAAFCDCYTGSGRFEASIGFVGSGGDPFVYEVGPSEEAVTPVDPTILQFTRTQIPF